MDRQKLPGSAIDNAAVAVLYLDGLVFGLRSGVATVSVIYGEQRRDIPVTVTP